MRKSKLLWFFHCCNKDITKRITFTKEEKCNIRRFSEFLLSHNAFNEFFINFNDYWSQESLTQSNETSSLSPLSYIQFAFSWMNTPQGEKFWNELNHKWYNEIRPQNRV